MTRFAYANSHDENPDTGLVVNPDEIAATLAAAFAFMRRLDEGHFDGLCAAVGVAAEELVQVGAG